MTKLDCSNNNINSLPKLSINLTEFICTGNNISDLVRLPRKIEYISIDLLYDGELIYINSPSMYKEL